MWLRISLLGIVGVACLSAVTGCSFPHDPEDTLNRVRNGVLRVGVVEQFPWAYHDDDEGWRGAEVEMVAQLADRLQAKIHWVPGNESSLIQLLERYELDLVIGGLTNKASWSKNVGLTQPFHTSRVALGIQPGEEPPQDLSGVEVAAVRGSFAAALAREEGAEVIFVPSLQNSNRPVAAQSWQIAALGRVEAGEPMQSQQHVWAVPPGENGWLLFLDRALPELSREVAARLAELERQRLGRAGSNPQGTAP